MLHSRMQSPLWSQGALPPPLPTASQQDQEEPVKKRDRMALRRSIVNSIVDIVEDLVVSGSSPEEDTWEDGVKYWKGPEVMEECEVVHGALMPILTGMIRDTR